MATTEKTLNELFHNTLRDIYYAEQQILKALPRMAKAAQEPELTAAFEKHHTETEGQIERLVKVFEMIDKRPQGKPCEAIIGILDEGKEVMAEFKGAPALDAGLVAGAQAVEHYEMARYGTLKTWATTLGLTEAAKLLDQTLQEETKTDQLLSQLGDRGVNKKAA